MTLSPKAKLARNRVEALVEAARGTPSVSLSHAVQYGGVASRVTATVSTGDWGSGLGRGGGSFGGGHVLISLRV